MSHKTDSMAALRKRNAVKANAHYSGGNDEGGVDEIVLVLKDGTTETIHPQYAKWDRETGKQIPLTREEEAINDLFELLASPVYNEYGSFAGDFHCHGVVVYDVEENTVKMTDNYGENVYRVVDRSW